VKNIFDFRLSAKTQIEEYSINLYFAIICICIAVVFGTVLQFVSALPLLRFKQLILVDFLLSLGITTLGTIIQLIKCVLRQPPVFITEDLSKKVW
jgi:hypothetical protein